MSKYLFAEETREEKDKKKKDAEKISRKYYNLKEEEMQALITRFKQGDETAKEEILNVFHNFLQKYVSLLMHKRCDLRDYDIRKFVSLFAKKNAKSIQYNNIDAEAYAEVNEVLNGINYMVKRYGTIEDVTQTVHMTFFSCLDRYERKGSIPFSGFLYNYFLYRLKRNVEEHLISQLGRKSFGLNTDDSVSSSYEAEKTWGGDNTIDDLTMKAIEESDDSQFHAIFDEIDEDWVRGDSAQWPFSELEIHERQLLKWKYVDKLKGTHIANKVGGHANTVRQTLHKIESKIKDIVGDRYNEVV